jgi:hypothetical protein
VLVVFAGPTIIPCFVECSSSEESGSLTVTTGEKEIVDL